MALRASSATLRGYSLIYQPDSIEEVSEADSGFPESAPSSCCVAKAIAA